MVLYTAVAALTIVLAFQIKPTSYGEYVRTSRQNVFNFLLLACIFTVLSALAALRHEVGNDYGTYVVTCHEIFVKGYVVTEPGYNLVVRILYTLSGKEDYLLMFAVFGMAIVAIFLQIFKKQSDSFALSFYLFMTLGIYFRSFNTVRYYFVLALAIYSLNFIVDDLDASNIIKFLAVILFAATFHKSVLAVIPMYFIARLKWNKWIIGAMTAGAIVVLMLNRQLLNLVLKLYPSYANTEYVSQTHSIFENAPIIIRCILVIALCGFCYREAIENRIDNRTYMNLNIMAIVLYICCYWMPLVTRFGYYLITSQILLIPNIIMAIEDRDKRKRLTYIVMGIGIIYFVYFLLTAGNDGVRVLPYKSWLFYDHRWLDQRDLF